MSPTRTSPARSAATRACHRHDRLHQCHLRTNTQSDWTSSRHGRGIGYEMGMDDGRFYFASLCRRRRPAERGLPEHSDPLQTGLWRRPHRVSPQGDLAERSARSRSRAGTEWQAVVIGSASEHGGAAIRTTRDHCQYVWRADLYAVNGRCSASDGRRRGLGDRRNHLRPPSPKRTVSRAETQSSKPAPPSAWRVGDHFEGQYTSARAPRLGPTLPDAFLISGRQDRSLLASPRGARRTVPFGRGHPSRCRDRPGHGQ